MTKRALVALLVVTAACDQSIDGPPGPNPGVDAWPHEPAGFTVMTDEPFAALEENGWFAVQRQATNGSGLSLVADAAAPLSPSGVLKFTYASGFEGGSEPGIAFYEPPSPVRETYFAFWWKPSNPWQNHETNINTIAILVAASDGLIFVQIDGADNTVSVLSEFLTDNRNMPPNVRATPLVLGAWHRIEWYVKYSTSATSHDGVTRWWLDGELQGDYRDLQLPADAGFVQYQLAPTWGGTGGTKMETDFFWFDHVHISTP